MHNNNNNNNNINNNNNNINNFTRKKTTLSVNTIHGTNNTVASNTTSKSRKPKGVPPVRRLYPTLRLFHRLLSRRQHRPFS